MMICDSLAMDPVHLHQHAGRPRERAAGPCRGGAGGRRERLQIFREITWPQIVPVAVTVLLIRMIEAFKIVDLPNIMTGGGPGIATESMTLHSVLRLARQRHRHVGGGRLSAALPHRRRLRLVLQLRRARQAESAGMTAQVREARTAALLERLFEPPGVGKMSPVAKRAGLLLCCSSGRSSCCSRSIGSSSRRSSCRST